MDAETWLQRWRDGRIAFHESAPNPLLVSHFDRLDIPRGSRVFLPLCGKTLDIAWLLSQGYRVVGAEFSEIAIEQLFAELGAEPTISALDKLTHYGAENIDIFVGDIFDLTASTLGLVDAIYDRAALVALPADMRKRYASHLLEITASAPQFLICFEYDQTEMDGPPFAVPANEVRMHYADHFDVSKIVGVDVAGGLKGKCAATEIAWLLKTDTPAP